MKQPAFGKKLTEIRTAKGITQDELAEKCKISVRTIQRIESGVVKPRAFTMKAISATLEFDFFEASNYTREDAKNNHSNKKWYSGPLWQLKDLFNPKTHTMKKLSILLVIICLIILGAYSITNNHSTQKAKAQEIEISEYPKFLEFSGGGVNYKFPKGKLRLSGEFYDTIYYFLEKDLIQIYKNNIFLNRSFVDKALTGDTVIYENRKVIIKSPYKYLEFSSHGIYYKYQEGELEKSSGINYDTTFHYLKRDLIQVFENNIFLNRSFIDKVIVGDTVVYRNREVYIKPVTAKFVILYVYGIIYKYPTGELEISSRTNDTTYHILKKDLIQEYKNNIFLNRSFVGKALVGDSVIYQNRKVIIKSAYSE